MAEEKPSTFQCPRCFQIFEVPPVEISVIVQHMRETHGEKQWEARYVRRRLKEKV